MAGLFLNGLKPEDYVHDFYKVETFLKIYSHAINPISGVEMWETSPLPQVLPPPIDPPKPGRPKKARKKSRVELEKYCNSTKLTKKGRKIFCSICRREGHNKRWHGTKAGAPTASVDLSSAADNSTRKKQPVKRKRSNLPSND